MTKEEAIEKALDTKVGGDHPKVEEEYRIYPGTLRDFLAECLITLFIKVDNFNGKRPICDSGWVSSVAACLLPIDSTIGHWEEYDWGVEFEVTDWESAEAAMKEVVYYVFKKRAIALGSEW